MIISLFGPDGAGKSTMTSELSEAGWTVFSGTGVASWPDKSWHNELTTSGIDETTLDSEDHFVEKVIRLHAMAGRLAYDHEFVVIDSDPLHKTIMYDYLRSLPDTEKAKRVMSDRFTMFKRLLGYGNPTPVIHTFFQVSEKLDDETQADILHQRITARGKAAYFDPQDRQGSLNRIRACRELKNLLDESSEKVLTVTTDKTFDFAAYRQQIAS